MNPMFHAVRHACGWLAVAATATLVACGGGGGSSEPAPVVASGPPANGLPTATVAASSQTAGDAVSTAKSSASALNKADSVGKAMPFGVQLGAQATLLSVRQVGAPLAVTQTQSQACTSGGTIEITAVTANANTLATGDTARAVFRNCSEFGVTMNGTMDMTFTRFVSETNLAVNYAVTGMTITQAGVTEGPVTMSGTVDINGSTITATQSVDGQTIVGAPTVSRSGNSVTIASGTARATFGGSGFVELQFSNWSFDRTTGRPTSGTVTVTGASGNRALVTVATDGYHVAITVGGQTTNYVVGF